METFQYQINKYFLTLEVSESINCLARHYSVLRMGVPMPKALSGNKNTPINQNSEFLIVLKSIEFSCN